MYCKNELKDQIYVSNIIQKPTKFNLTSPDSNKKLLTLKA